MKLDLFATKGTYFFCYFQFLLLEPKKIMLNYKFHNG